METDVFKRKKHIKCLFPYSLPGGLYEFSGIFYIPDCLFNDSICESHR